jgi:hypothetical protein
MITNNVISLSNFLKVKIFVDAKKVKIKQIKNRTEGKDRRYLLHRERKR